ncbi:MAG: hypothetical protein WC548_00940 [Candidatus Pacearchaeota archaeon]
MNSKQTSAIASHPIILNFTLQLLKTIKENKLEEYKEKILIDAELVPNFHSRKKASMLEPKPLNEKPKYFSFFKKKTVPQFKSERLRSMVINPSRMSLPIEIKIPVEEQKPKLKSSEFDLLQKNQTEMLPHITQSVSKPREILSTSKIIQPKPQTLQPISIIKREIALPTQKTAQPTPEIMQPAIETVQPKLKTIQPKTEIIQPVPKITQPTSIIKNEIVPKKSITPQEAIIPIPAKKVSTINFIDEYGSITPLLRDPSVNTIECSGAGKQIKVIKGGQKQITKIIFSEEEIKSLLEKISNSVHIPLLEGVFRAAIDNFTISAIVSQITGSKFIIRKQTPLMIFNQ